MFAYLSIYFILWSYWCVFQIRGLSIDEAIKQCSFHKKKCPHIVKEVSRI